MPESIVRKFYADLKKGKMWGQKCKDCGKWNFPPKGSCKSCGSLKVEMKEVSGKGKLIMYSMSILPPKKFADVAPYAYGMVKLAEGPIFMTQIKGVPYNKVEEIQATNAKCPLDVQAKVVNLKGLDIVVFEVKK
jgi:uncharacterized OB-fold protein